MDNLISFLELRLVEGNLSATLGSGPCSEVLTREVSDPYVRICMQDSEATGCRVRFGTARLTDAGINYDGWDAHQLRGASSRLFAWAPAVARQLGNHEKELRELFTQVSGHWLKCFNGRIVGIPDQRALEELAGSPTKVEDCVFVRFQVPPAQAKVVLAQLALV